MPKQLINLEGTRLNLYKWIVSFLEKGYYFEYWMDEYFFNNNIAKEGVPIVNYWTNTYTEGVKKTICIKYKFINVDRYTVGEICLINNRKTYKLPEFKNGKRLFGISIIRDGD